MTLNFSQQGCQLFWKGYFFLQFFSKFISKDKFLVKYEFWYESILTQTLYCPMPWINRVANFFAKSANLIFFVQNWDKSLDNQFLIQHLFKYICSRYFRMVQIMEGRWTGLPIFSLECWILLIFLPQQWSQVTKLSFGMNLKLTKAWCYPILRINRGAHQGHQNKF